MLWEEQEALLSVELQPGTNTPAGSCPLPPFRYFFPCLQGSLCSLNCWVASEPEEWM